MNLEKQVCSLELSKRLKELGVKQESLFVWISIIKTGFDFLKLRESFEPDSEGIGAYNYAAFTVAELGEILPTWFDSAKRQHDYWICRVMEVRTDKMHHCIGETEAEARAKMLIYLLENKLMETPND